MKVRKIKQMGFTVRKIKQMGFTLIEAMVVLAIAGVVVGVVVYQQGRADASQRANQMASDMSLIATKVKSYYRPSNSFSALNASNLNKMALINAPMSFDGSNVKDPWGNTMTIAGGTTTFSISVGGTTQALDKEVCNSIATTLADAATVIRVGTSAGVSTSGATQGQVSGGNLYKNGSAAPDAALLATGCNETTPVIALQF